MPAGLEALRQPLEMFPIDSPAERDILASILTVEGLAAADISSPNCRLFAFRDPPSRQDIGYGGLELFGRTALLRSIMVKPLHRRSGCGAAIVDRLLREASRLNVAELYLLTIHAAPFFERLGFAPIGRAEVPASVADSAEFSSLCPSTASVMYRRIGTAEASNR